MSDTFDGVNIEYFVTPSNPLPVKEEVEERPDEDDDSSEEQMRIDDMLEAHETSECDRMSEGY